MEAIEQLEQAYYLLAFDIDQRQNCIDWAIQRLKRDQEGDDWDIVRLTSANKRDDLFSLVEKIVERYVGFSALDEQLAAGKYIVTLRRAYLANVETIDSLDRKLGKLYYALDYPDWLVMLSRNCECATDIPAFVEPFEQEFAYVAGLWAAAKTTAEFEAKYRREVSNQHDIKYR